MVKRLCAGGEAGRGAARRSPGKTATGGEARFWREGCEMRAARKNVAWLMAFAVAWTAATAFGQWPFSAKGYAESISARAAVVPLQTVAEAFTAPEAFSAESLSTGGNLSPKTRACLLLALQNNGNQRAWGVAEMVWNGHVVAVDVPGLPPNMAHPFFNVVEVSDFAGEDGFKGAVEVRWRELHAK